MPRTVNRRVQGVDNVDYDDLGYQYQNMSTPSGINESKNFVAVDQNSLADANNVYINEDGVLSSRPAIKSVTIPYITNDTEIVDLINVDGVVFYHLFRNNEYSVAFKHNNEWKEHACSSKLTIAFMLDMYVFFTINDIFAYKITGEWKTYSDIIYIPKIIKAGQSETVENANIFVDGTTTRYVITSDTETIFSELNGKNITVTIDDDSYSMTFVTGMQSVFTRKINTMTVSNVSVSSKGNLLSYATSVVNNKLVVTVYYSADGTLFHELPPLPINSSLGDILSYNVVLSNNGGAIYCLLKGSVKTVIYYIATASLSAWIYADAEYATFNHVQTLIDSPVNVNVESNYESISALDVDGDTKGYALDDDYVVFYTRRPNRAITCVTNEYDADYTNTTVLNCQQSFLHIAKVVSGVMTVKSYSIIDNFDHSFSDNEIIKPSLNCIAQLKLSTDSVSENTCIFMILAENYSVSWTGQRIYLAKILLNSSLEPKFNIKVLTQYNTSVAAVVNYIIDYSLLGNDYSSCAPTAVDLCHTFFNNQAIEYRYCKYEIINSIKCYYETVSISQAPDTANINFITFNNKTIYDESGVNLLGERIQVTTSNFTSRYDTVTLQYGTTLTPKIIKSNANFSKILTTDELYISAYSTSFKLLHSNCIPVSSDWNDSILYISNNKLYAVDLTKEIYIDVIADNVKYNFIDVSKFVSFVNDFIAYDNKICYRSNKDNQIYFSIANEVKFASVVTNLIQLSQTSLAVFLSNSVYIVNYEGIDNVSNKPLYTYTKSKLQLGCRENDDVLLTYDGSTILLPTLKGLTSLSYEQLMINNEQVYSYLSEQLSDLYTEFANGSIKLYQYKSYIVVYSSIKKYCYIYDLVNQSWWKWSSSKILSKVIYDNESLLLLINGELFKLIDDGAYLDFGQESINWYFMSQKLHFGAPNNYKHIYALSLESSAELPEDVRYALTCMNYRKSKNVNDAEIFEYNINGIRLYVKRCNYYKSNAFQFKLSSVHQEKPKQLKLANIAIKYRITESIR